MFNLKRKYVTLYLSDAEVRTIRITDISEEYIEGLNDPDVKKYLVAPRKTKQTYGTVKIFVKENWESKCQILFGLFIGGKLKGTCRLHNITETKTDIGIAIFDKKIWGKRWGEKLLRVVTEYALKELCIKQVIAGVVESNIASLRIFEKIGYKKFKICDDQDSLEKAVHYNISQSLK